MRYHQPRREALWIGLLLRNKLPLLEKLIKLALPRSTKYPLQLKKMSEAPSLKLPLELLLLSLIYHITPSFISLSNSLFFLNIPTLKKANVIGIDERMIRWKRKGSHLYVWVVVDLERKEVLEVKVSRDRDGRIAMKLILERGLSSREIVTDRGPWYNWLDGWEYAIHVKERFGRRSLVERAMRWLKERLIGSLLLRSENLEYIEGMIKLIYFLKLAELSCLG